MSQERREITGLFTYSISGKKTRHELENMTESKFCSIFGTEWRKIITEDYGFDIELGNDHFFHLFCEGEDLLPTHRIF